MWRENIFLFLCVSEIHRKVASKQVTRGSISAVTLGTTGPIIEAAEESRSCCRKQWRYQHHPHRDAYRRPLHTASSQADLLAVFQRWAPTHTRPLPLDSLPSGKFTVGQHHYSELILISQHHFSSIYIKLIHVTLVHSREESLWTFQLFLLNVHSNTHHMDTRVMMWRL